MIKKILKPSVIILLCAIPFAAFAVSLENPLKANNFYELLNSIIDLLYTLSIPVAALMIIIAGFYFIFAQGDPGKVDTAKTIIKWTLIGFLIVVLAKGMVQLMQEIFMKT